MNVKEQGVTSRRAESVTLLLHLGDCIDKMQSLPEGSIGAIVTDPPYG